MSGVSLLRAGPAAGLPPRGTCDTSRLPPAPAAAGLGSSRLGWVAPALMLSTRRNGKGEKPGLPFPKAEREEKKKKRIFSRGLRDAARSAACWDGGGKTGQLGDGSSGGWGKNRFHIPADGPRVSKQSFSSGVETTGGKLSYQKSGLEEM